MCMTRSWRDLLIRSTMVLLMVFSAVFGPCSAQGQTVAISEGLKSAISHRRDDDTAAAIEVLEQALALAETPEEYAKIGALLGHWYTRTRQQPDRAIQVLQKVLAYDPEFEYCLALTADGELYEWRGRLAPPHEWVVERFPPGLPETPGAARIQPKPQQVWGIALAPRVTLGKAYYFVKGDKPAGLREWEIALERYPEAHGLQGNVYRAREELGLVGALDDFAPMVFVENAYFSGNIANAGDRLLVPATELAQRLSVVARAGSHGQVELASDTHRLLLSAGSRQAVLDGARITVPVAPVTVKGKMLVPLRFVAEAFGHRVDWEPLPRIAWVR